MSSYYQQVLGINNTSLAILVGLGIGIFGFNLNEMIANKIKSSRSKKAAELLKKKYENLTDKELSQEFKQVLQSYSKQFEDSKIFEKIIEKKVEDQTQIRQLSKGFTYTYEDEQQEDLIKCLSEPIWEMLNRGGKRIRPIFCALIAEAYNYKLINIDYFTKKQDVIEIAGFIEVLHNCSLIIDDIEDDSYKRREKDAVHIIYGVDISINAANYGYYAPLNYLLNLKKYDQKTISQLSLIYAYEMSQIHLGQGWDLLWHNQKKDELRIPSENQYLQMVVNKTGALFRMMIKMLGVVLKLDQSNVKMLSLFTEKVGAVFQIQDDIINLDSRDYTTKGIRGEDITEGKITVIAIHALNNNTEEKKQRLFEILCMKTQDQTLIDEAIEIMQQSGSIKYAKELASQIMEKAWQQLDKSLPESESKYKLKLICQYILKRQS